MEPMRPIVDRKVLDFALSHTFTPGDFTINRWGGCWLNPQMAKIIAGRVIGLDIGPVIKGFLKSL
jgi:hypothetical protein